MNRMNEEAKTALERLLSVWPYKDDEADRLAMMRDYVATGDLARDCDPWIFATARSGSLVVQGPAVFVGDEAVFLVVDYAKKHAWSHLARLRLGTDARWRLRRFDMQCTGCLGYCENAGEPCASCEATGWGDYGGEPSDGMRSDRERLKQLFAAWPGGQDDRKAFRGRFSAWLSEDFNPGQLETRLPKPFVFSETIELGTRSKTLLYAPDDVQHSQPYLVVCSLTPSKGTQLRSVSARCRACGGCSVSQDDSGYEVPCAECGARGWI